MSEPKPKSLTDRTIRALRKPPSGRVDIADRKAPGLVLRVTSNGSRSWAVRYRPKGMEQRRETLGEYPTVALATARRRAFAVAAAAREGVDLPAKEARDRALEAARSRTVTGMLGEYIDGYCKPHQRRWQQTKRLIEQHLIPHLGELRLVDLRREHGAELMDKLEKAGLRAQVNRARSQLVAALNWAVERGYLEANPLAAVKRRKNLETPRGRVLSDAELRAIWHTADSLSDPSRALVKVLALLGQRRDEIRCMPRSEIVAGTNDWLLPARRNKPKRDHLLPLPSAVVEIINSLPNTGPYVFSADGKRPYAGQRRLLANLRRKSGVTGWTFHDLRRTCATGMAAIGIAQDTIDRVLNHAKGKLAGTYNVHDYSAEKAGALKAWAERVAIVVSGGLQAPNVRELRPAAG
jgi:integrase